MNLYSNGLSNFFVENATGDKLLKNRRDFKRIVKEYDFTNKDSVTTYYNIVKDASEDELTKYLEIFNSELNIKSAREAFLAAQMLNVIIHAHTELSDEQVKYVSNIFNKIEDAHLAHKDEKEARGCNDILRTIGHRVDIIREEALCGIGFNDDDVYHRTAVDIERYTAMFESAAVVYDNVQTDVSGLAKKNEVPDIRDLTEFLKDFSYNKVNEMKPDTEFLVCHIKEIPGYVHHVLSSNKVTDDMIDGIFWLISQTHSAIRRNNEGLSELFAALENIEDDIDTIQHSTFESFDAAKNMKMFITHIKASILTDRDNLVANVVIPDSNPLREMGCGYFFDIMPLNKEVTLEVANKLNEAVMETNVMSVIQESIMILNEARDPEKQTALEYAINAKRAERKDKIDIRKDFNESKYRDKLEKKREPKQDTSDLSDPEKQSTLKYAIDSKRAEKRNKIDIRREFNENNYKEKLEKEKQDAIDKKNAREEAKQSRIDERKSAKTAKADARREDREARRNTKLEYKKQLRELKRDNYKQKLERKLQDKQDRYDERYNRKKENRENARTTTRNNLRATAAGTVEGLRSLSGTSAGWQKVKSALSDAISSVVGGAGIAALTGIDPIVGAACILIKKWAKQPASNSPLAKSYTRGKMVTDLDAEITRLDNKIREYESQGNMQAVTKLESLKSKLERTKESIYNDAAYNGGVVR